MILTNLVVVVVGAAIGTLGSAIAIRRFLDV
jgi:cell division protein FtsX